MSQNLKNCIKELQVAMKYKDKPTRHAILKFLSNKKCVYKALREISMNIVNKQIPLNKRQLRLLNPHVKTIKRLKSGTKNKHIRRRLVTQSGGFLPWLIPIVGSVLSSILLK
jgi:hypothetical protein